jgi:hypothetical protein
LGLELCAGVEIAQVVEVVAGIKKSVVGLNGTVSWGNCAVGKIGKEIEAGSGVVFG